MHRIDTKNRQPMPAGTEAEIIGRLREIVPGVDGVIIADQVPEANCGTITDRVRAEIETLAQEHRGIFFAADSRERIGEFRHVIVKPNASEALAAISARQSDEINLDIASECGTALHTHTGRPVFLTMGDQGILLVTDAGPEQIPGIHVDGEIDIVGAGDSFMAGSMLALCSGASPQEAALLGNLVASITIQQIGTTGTATPAQVLQRFDQTQHG